MKWCEGLEFESLAAFSSIERDVDGILRAAGRNGIAAALRGSEAMLAVRRALVEAPGEPEHLLWTRAVAAMQDLLRELRSTAAESHPAFSRLYAFTMENADADEAHRERCGDNEPGILRRTCGDQPSSSQTVDKARAKGGTG